MSFSDVFKKNFIENYTGTIGIQLVIITLLVALVFSVIVFYVYKITNKSTIYSKSFNISMSLITIITAGVVLSMQANIVVSLGMVGALSIVRFRTAIKEPRDLLFLFWSISNGIIIGAGVYSLVFIMGIVITCGLLWFDILPVNKIPLLLVVNIKDNKDYNDVIKVLNNNVKSYKVKTRNYTKDRIDIVFEFICKNQDKLVNELAQVKSIESYNLIYQDGTSDI